MRRLANALVAGAFAGLVAGLCEGILAIVGQTSPGSAPGALVLIACMGLSVLAGAAAGLFTLPLLLLWPPDGWRRAGARVRAPAIYGVGVALPLLLATLFRLAHRFRITLKDATLASFALTVAALGAMVMAALVAVATAQMVRRVAASAPVVARRSIAVSAVLLFWVALSLPGLIAGPDRALSGPFGFIGLLRKDTIDWTPVLLLAVLVSALAVAHAMVAQRARIARIGFAAAAATAVIAATVASAQAGPRLAVLGNAVLSRLVLRGMQRVGDRDGDGASRWLGGGDCDDANSQRHPGAREIAGNGSDEDCDGEDAALAAPEQEVAAARPQLPSELSFLIITVDALRPELGVTGYPRDVSPHIDALARKSTVYERAYGISTYTGYCIPPMMASRYPTEMPRTSMHEVRYLPENVLLAERLREQGFQTAGAASHFLFTRDLQWTDGFDRFVISPAEGDAPADAHLDLFHTSRTLADDTIKLLRSVERQRFLLWVHFLDPHKQYVRHEGFSKWGDAPRDLYDGEVAYTDSHIGRLLRELDTGPARERTVVIITADHGEAFGEHGMYFHGSEVWDEVVRVPLIVYVPGLAPRRVTRRVSTLDLAPTILDLANLPADEGARGSSLLLELAGTDLPERPILIDQPKNPYYDGKRAFIKDGFKLHHLVDANAWRMFDLERDPGETADLVDVDPDRARELRRAYSSYMASIPQAPVVAAVDPAAETETEPDAAAR